MMINGVPLWLRKPPYVWFHFLGLTWINHGFVLGLTWINMVSYLFQKLWEFLSQQHVFPCHDGWPHDGPRARTSFAETMEKPFLFSSFAFCLSTWTKKKTPGDLYTWFFWRIFTNRVEEEFSVGGLLGFLFTDIRNPLKFLAPNPNGGGPWFMQKISLQPAILGQRPVSIHPQNGDTELKSTILKMPTRQTSRTLWYFNSFAHRNIGNIAHRIRLLTCWTWKCC